MSLTAGLCTLLNKNVNSSSSSCSSIPEGLERFSLPKPFPMKLESFIDHFLYQLDLEESILPSAFLVLEPLLKYISQNNIHKLVFAALTIAYKAHIDKPVKNSKLEKIGVLKAKELVELEKVVLETIGWNLQYSRIDDVKSLLEKEGVQINEEKFSSENDDDETDFTEYGSNDSFSELSAFF